MKWIQDFEDSFTELILLGQKNCNDDKLKKMLLCSKTLKNIELVDSGFEEVVSDKSFIEACNLLRSHSIRHQQQNKEKDAR
jgi:hypothetical protein